MLRCNSFREQNIRFTDAAIATTGLVPEAGREVSRKSAWPLRRPYSVLEKNVRVRLISKTPNWLLCDEGDVEATTTQGRAERQLPADHRADVLRR